MTGKVISGQYVPEGTLVGVYHWVAGRYSRAWRNADSFIPERWLPNSNEYSEDWRNVIQPYQVGPRNCAGQVLANAELRLILAAMIVSFDMSLADEEQKDWLDFPIFGLMSDKKPLMVKLRPVS
jgi:cytochrome P450